MNGKNNVTSYTKCSLPQSSVHILIQPLLFAQNSFLLKCQINLLHTQCGGTRLCIRSYLLRERTASQLVAIVTRSDTGSLNRLDLMQSIVPPHYVCNAYLSFRSRNFAPLTKIQNCYYSWKLTPYSMHKKRNNIFVKFEPK